MSFDGFRREIEELRHRISHLSENVTVPFSCHSLNPSPYAAAYQQVTVAYDPHLQLRHVRFP